MGNLGRRPSPRPTPSPPSRNTTLGDLLHRAVELLERLARRILVRIAAEDIVLADETPVPVQAPGKVRRAYVWAFLGAVLIGFRYSASRSGLTPVSVLGSSAGTLVVDGYTGYKQARAARILGAPIAAGAVVPAQAPDKRERSGCLAHVRRKFADARGTEAVAANRALDLILSVYRVEHEAKALRCVRNDDHLKLRQEKSAPAMQAFKDWLATERSKHLPSGPVGKAISSAVNQWQFLTAFLHDARIPVDNNASERALRTYALRRKNLLFVGNDVAGEHLAVLMSLVRSCEAAGVNPKVSITDMLMRVQTHPMARIDELLPDACKPATHLAPIDSG